MDQKQISERYGHCDHRFYPYMEKVFKRLPEEILSKEILNDLTLQIISLGSDYDGQYVLFENPIKHLIFLRKDLLNQPEYQIIHTIAHEIAHKIFQSSEKNKFALCEKEAEALIVNWGFVEESKAVDYYRPSWESGGFDIGYEWAAKQDKEDLIKFKEFYDEWNEGRLNIERYEELFYVTNIISIQYEMGRLKPEITLEEAKEMIEKGEVEVAPEDAGIFMDKGIIHGIMSFLKSKKGGRR